MTYKGSFVALVTPFDKHLEVDYRKVAELVEWHISEGTDGIVIGGSTGECMVLNQEEKEKILQTVLNVSKNRVPVIMGTGCSDTRSSVNKTKKAKELGADGCLVVVPYYNKPTEQGCFQHFYEISRVGLPLIVYHHPGRTGIKLSARLLSEIVALPHVVGVKDSSGDLNLIEDLLTKSDTTIFCGDDELTYPFMQKGAQGVISVVANLIPKEWSQLVSAFFDKDYDRALRIQKRYQKLNEALFLEVNPQGIKYSLSLVGKCESFLRLPLVMPKEETKAAIRQVMAALSIV